MGKNLCGVALQGKWRCRVSRHFTPVDVVSMKGIARSWWDFANICDVMQWNSVKVVKGPTALLSA